MPTTLKELRGEAEARRKKLHEIFEQAGPDLDMSQVKVIEGDSEAKVKAIRDLNDELADLGQKIEPLEADEKALREAKEHADRYGELEEHPGHPSKGRKDRERDQKGLAEHLYELAGVKLDGDSRVNAGDLKGRTFDADIDVKTLFQTTAGWEPEVTRTGRMVDKAVQPIDVLDVIPTGTTKQTAVKFMEETVFTNGAKETKEAAEYAEGALKLAEAESPVRKIAVWLPVTDEQLEDIPQAQGYINRRLPFMLRQRLNTQSLAGDGESPNLTGFLEVEGILSQAKGADPTPDAIYKAFTKLEVEGRVMGLFPVIVHPNDWQQVRLLRTADGIYIWGSPSEAGPERIWGHQVVKASSITEGTALTGDFANYTELAFKRGIEMKVTDSHGEDFIHGKQAIRADMRVALVVYRPAALCEITGI